MSERNYSYTEDLIKLYLPSEYSYKFLSANIITEPTLKDEISFTCGKFLIENQYYRKVEIHSLRVLALTVTTYSIISNI